MGFNSKTPAKLAPPTVNPPLLDANPALDEGLSGEINIPLSKVYTTKVKLSVSSRLSPLHFFSALVLFLVIALQFLTPRESPFVYSPTITRHNLPIDFLRQSIDEQTQPEQCPNFPVFYEKPGVCRPHKMALVQEAQRIAAQFDYPGEQVAKAVKHFITQMDEGLEKQGATMSQIPTYVTDVPNGTEKVGQQLLPPAEEGLMVS